MGALYRFKNLAKIIGVVPGIDGDQVLVTNIANGSNVTLYTVPADKVLLFDYYSCYASITGGIGPLSLVVYSALGAIKIYVFAVYAAVGLNKHKALSFSRPIELIAGDYFLIGSNIVGNNLTATISGILVDQGRGLL